MIGTVPSEKFKVPRLALAHNGHRAPIFWLPAAAFLLLMLIALIRIGRGDADQGSFHIYQAAVQAWWSHSDPYGSGIHGFLYLPSSIVLFTPFALLGQLIGGIAWCLLSACLYASGLVRLSWQLSDKRPWQVLGLALFAVWFSLKPNLSDGQMQIIMTGLLLHAAADLGLRQWPRAAGELALAFAFKPIAIAALGVALLLYPPLRKWLFAAVVCILLLPLVGQEVGFVAEMYHSALIKMAIAGAPGSGDWPWLADISTMLGALGLPLTFESQLVLRILAALAIVLIAIRCQKLSLWNVSFALLSLALLYLTLFNPRNEADSYVALTPVLALGAGLLLSHNLRTTSAWLLLAAAVALGVRWGRSIDGWFKPAVALGYFACVAGAIIWRRPVVWLGRGDVVAPHPLDASR